MFGFARKPLLARFGHHEDPVRDFLSEVSKIAAFRRESGPFVVLDRIERAIRFRIGSVPALTSTRSRHRVLSAKLDLRGWQLEERERSFSAGRADVVMEAGR